MERYKKDMRPFNSGYTDIICFLICCIVLLSSCSGVNDQDPSKAVLMEADPFPVTGKTYPTPLGLFPDYHISPGDVLDILFQIRTWRRDETFKLEIDHTISVKFVYSPELNETQRIRPDGNVSLPYVGNVNVLGKTPSQLTEELTEKYKDYLRDPLIYITVPEFRSRIKELKKDLHTSARGLSRLVTVRPDGYATFPLTGDVFVATKTLPEVEKELDAIYDDFLKGLHVDLFLEKHSGSLVYILGQVNKASSYNIRKPITILEAISMAGSFTAEANTENIIVYRKRGDEMTTVRVNLSEILSPTESGSYFYLKPDDILYIPREGYLDFADVIQTIARIVMFRGWSISVEKLSL